MTTKPTIHIPHKDSPETYLTAGIDDDDTVLTVADASIFDAAGITRLTLGLGTAVTETVTVVDIINNEISVTRGTPAYSWPIDTRIARVITAEDFLELKQYLLYLEENLVTNANSHNHDGGDGAQIPTGGLANLAVTADKIANTTITGGKMVNATVTNIQLASNAVTTAKILDDAVTNAKLADPYDIIYFEVLDKDTLLEIADGLGYFFVPETHNGKKARILWAGFPVTPSSSGAVTIRFYNVTNAAIIDTVIIPEGDYSASTPVLSNYTLTANDIIRIDCTNAGTGAKGLHIQMKVDKT